MLQRHAMQVQVSLGGSQWTGTCRNIIEGKEAVRQIKVPKVAIAWALS